MNLLWIPWGSGVKPTSKQYTERSNSTQKGQTVHRIGLSLASGRFCLFWQKPISALLAVLAAKRLIWQCLWLSEKETL